MHGTPGCVVHFLEIGRGGKGRGVLRTDAAEGPGITVYPSVLRLVCIQLHDMHVAAMIISIQPGWQHSMNCHALRLLFAAPLKQYVSSLTVNGCFTDKLVWWFQSKSKGKSRFAPAGSAGEGEEEDSPSSRKPARADLHAWSTFESVS